MPRSRHGKGRSTSAKKSPLAGARSLGACSAAGAIFAHLSAVRLALFHLGHHISLDVFDVRQVGFRLPLDTGDVFLRHRARQVPTAVVRVLELLDKLSEQNIRKTVKRKDDGGGGHRRRIEG